MGHRHGHLTIVWVLLSDEENISSTWVRVWSGSGLVRLACQRNRRIRTNIRELQALAYKVTLEPAA
jgi:hypothetical protein